MKQIAIYPGSFDPLTFGHIDIVKRSSKIFDKVIIAIAQNSKKTPFLTIEERIELVFKSLPDSKNIEVLHFDNLLVDFAKKCGANIILRGIRAVSDFEYEFALSGMNKHLDDEIETIFMTPNEQYANISSTLVREISSLGGDIRRFVPPIVDEYLKSKKSI